MNGQSWSGSKVLNQAGQTTAFSVDAVPTGTGGRSATFTLLAKGDYSPGSRHEYLDWDIDGIVSGRGRPATGLGTVVSGIASDVEWTQSFAVSSTDFAAIFADGELVVTLQNSSEVNCCFESTDYHGYELTAVPVPAAAWLFGGALMGMIGVGAKRRR
jgi:hypothetical protein